MVPGDEARFGGAEHDHRGAAEQWTLPPVAHIYRDARRTARQAAHSGPGSGVDNESGPRGSRRAAAARRAWARIDRDGWRAQYAGWIAREVATGRYTPAEAWRFWHATARAIRRSRRRADAVRRISRMDRFVAAAAMAAGYGAQQPRSLGPGWAAPPDAHPRRAVRRYRVGRFVVRAVAAGFLRSATVPDAWTVARASADGIRIPEPTTRRDSHPASPPGDTAGDDRR